VRLIANITKSTGNITNHAARDLHPDLPVCGAPIYLTQPTDQYDQLNCGRCYSILERQGKLPASVRGDPRK